jgi:WD40 repeat protein/predicted Ser/Thr protein kinase
VADRSSDRVEALFYQAADLPPAEQRTLLDAACADDPGLRAEVEKLLARDAHLRTDDVKAGFFISPLLRLPPDATVITDPLAAAERPVLPARIGPYRIVRRLGEGGMGTVYEAEQDNPRRRVALKVIRPDLVTPDMVNRFSQEAQILGRLQHAGIAQIYGAGVAADGQPYFAMEFIHGLPLDKYARSHGLDAAARLNLVARVCDAVQHAHDKGVIHRDLKPANILVDETGQPKVLDFGVARAADADLRTQAERTRTGQLLGTLSYMSPEQVVADPATLDARSDVYTLGVILFELLADRLPYHLDHLPLPEMARVIREQEPSRLGSVNPVFRGDVEIIVARALEKDRARRYQIAAELASDIRRYLADEPIRARPPSALYQLAKFARRHKALVSAVAGILAALAVGLVGTILFAVRAAEERTQAEQSARRATAEKQAAQYQTYRARIGAAGAALQNHDVADAARHLAEAPESLRNWEWRHLHSRLDDSSAVLPAPAGGVFFLLRGRDGLRIGTFSPTGTSLADLEGRELRHFPVHPWRAGNFFFQETPRGLWALSERPDRSVCLADERGHVRVRIANPGKEGPSALALSPTRAQLAVAWKDFEGVQFVGLYDTSSGRELGRCAGRHTDRVGFLAFSPDGNRLVSASDDFTAQVWDPADGQWIAGFKGHTSKVLGVTFRRDGARILTASSDGKVCQWDPRTGVEVEPPYEGHTGEVVTAAYSPDGRWVASAGTDRTLRVWRATGREEAAVLHGHTGTINALAFTRDGRRLVSLSQGAPVNSRCDNTVRIWEASTPTTLPVLRGHASYVYPVAYSPDGQWIASGSWDGTVRLWDALTGAPCAELRLGSIVRTLAFDPTGRWLVTGCDRDSRLQVWEVATARFRKALPGPAGWLGAVAVRPDGAQVAALTFQGQLQVVEVATGRKVFHVDQKIKAMRPLVYSPDGRWLAGTARDLKTICLWDTQTYQVAARFSGHTDLVHALAFSPDGSRLASGGQDRVVRVWDVATTRCRAELHGHTDAVFAAAFHRGGTRLATAGNDRAVWLWDLERCEEVARLPGHATYVWSLAFSPDGRTLVSGSGDHTVRLWDTRPLRVRHRARRAVESRRPQARRLVDRLWKEKKQAAQVVEALKEDRDLSDPLRRAAFHALLDRARRSP